MKIIFENVRNFKIKWNFKIKMIIIDKIIIFSQKLEQDDDDEYLHSSWADGSSLKRHFQGLNNISWKPH